MRDLLDADRVRGFDLSAPPLMRIHLVRNSLDAHVLVWSFHHILLDGWSVSGLLDQVFGGAVRPVPSYREFIGWLDEQDVDAAETYWRGALAGFTESTPLGIDRVVATEDAATEPTVHTTVIKDSIASALSLLARSRRVTVNAVVQAAWALLLARVSGERDVVFGTTVS
ncbi:non-ribosomal peptide synthetase, partial [Streptomyces parvus]